MFSKKVLSMALTAALTLSAAPVFAGTQFKDVNDAKLDDGYNTAINFLAGVGIVSGDNNGNFNPNDNVKRSEVAKIIDNTLGYGKLASASKPSTTKFSDVTKDQWYAGYVNVATQKGLVKGVSDTKFAPDDNVTYAQYLTIALRALGYSDDDLTGTWPLNYVTKAVELGLLDGLDNVDPNEKATRKDIAVITYNTLYTVTKDDTYNTNSQVLAYKPWLIDHVSSALGVVKVTGYVVGDKTTDATLADTVKVATDYKNSVGNTVSSPANDTTTFSFSVSDEQKAKFGLGAKVTFYATTNYNNNKKIVYVESAKRDVLTITPTRTIGSADTVNGNVYFNYKVNNNDTKAVVNTNAFTLINGKHYSSDDVTKVDATTADTTLTLINNDDDAKYDFVIATSVKKPVIVSHDVLAADTSIQLSGGATVDLKVKDADVAGNKANATVKVTGAVSNLGDIKRGDVIYVSAPTDNSVVNIEVVRNVFSGKVTATTVDSGKYSNVTVNGAVYTFVTNPSTADFGLGDSVDIKAGKNNVILTIKKTDATFDLSNYGIILAKGYQEASKDQYGTVTDAVYHAKFTKLDGNGTSTDLKVKKDVYNALSTPSVVKVSTDSDGYSTFTPDSSVTITKTTGDNYKAAQKADDTKLYITNAGIAGVALADQKSVLSSFATKSVPTTSSDNLYLITKTSGLNNYAAVIVVAKDAPSATNQDITTFGYIKSFNGGAYVGTQAVKVYTALVNGTAVTLNVKDDSSVVVPTYFASVAKDANGVVTSFASATSITNATVAGMDSTKIKIGSNIYSLDANTKVYDKDGNAKALSDVQFRVDNAETFNVDVVITADGSKVAVIKMNN